MINQFKTMFANFQQSSELLTQKEHKKTCEYFASLCKEIIDTIENPEMSWDKKHSNSSFLNLKNLLQDFLHSPILDSADRADFNTRHLRSDTEYYMGKATYPGFGLKERSGTMHNIISFIKETRNRLKEEAQFCQ